jgi:hypothetical protein
VVDEFIVGAIQNSFAIGVAAWLLVRMESRLDRLTEAIGGLRTAIELYFARAARRGPGDGD